MSGADGCGASAGMGDEPFPATEPGMDAPNPGVDGDGDDEEGPTRTFQNDDVAVTRRPKTLTGTQTSEELRSRSSSIRTRSSPAMAAAPAAAVGQLVGCGGRFGFPARDRRTGDDRRTARGFGAVLDGEPPTGRDDELAGGLRRRAAAPGFASGEASGLIDIRALASLARQNHHCRLTRFSFVLAYSLMGSAYWPTPRS